MALDASIGGTASDSYVDMTFADAYHAARGFSSDFSGATTDNKERALKWATRLLDVLPWTGYRVASTQALRWPRSNALDRDGTTYANTIIPIPVKNATCELALALVAEDRTKDSGSIGVESLSVGPISLAFDKGAYTKAIPDNVMALIDFLLEGGVGSAFREVQRVG